MLPADHGLTPIRTDDTDQEEMTARCGTYAAYREKRDIVVVLN
jgi:hypothetical protein